MRDSRSTLHKEMRKDSSVASDVDYTMSPRIVYKQIELDKNDISKMAFVAHNDQQKYTRLQF